MSGYAKIFTRILDSTVWRESNPTRLLWITMLALADRDGIVRCTIPGLADRARISIEECEHGLSRFQQPDKYSWSRENEGRRIEVIDGGWSIINHGKFRQLMSADETREKTRIRVARHRDRKKESLRNVTIVTSNASNDIATATTTEAVKGSKLENTQKAVEGGELPKSPPLKFSQSDFDERDWRKISAAKTKIYEKLKGAMGGEPISEQQYHAWVAEESGVTVQRVMTLCKRNGGSNGTY